MGSSSTEVSTIVKNWREHPPASYSLKIHSFSQFENSSSSSDDKYQSRLFSSGRYKWYVLIVYPKGNEKDNGSGFISMYVEIDSKSLMVFTPPTEVFAEIRFFIYNKKENKYFTIQDVEVKRFNALKTVWGLEQILPCHCEFGVDVIVAPPLTYWEILSFTEKYSDPKFSCAIKNFSQFKENVYTPNSFSMAGKKWVLMVYPKGDSRADGKCLSIFLYLDDCDKPKDDEKIFVQANFRVLDPLGSNHFQHKFEKWYTEQNTAWGWPLFLSLAELQKSYLDKQDTLKVEIEFKVVSATKYSPII
ncbi:BnaA07g24170D [Brassica napus]|uniref:BnaA07g24170D protein n=1 Tax=Brassica napus TaxID=3708 RepID=A0A078F6P1_BRANA|nr:BnaA07g24170D [Brassica napus]